MKYVTVIPDFETPDEITGLENEMDQEVREELIKRHCKAEIARCNQYWKNHAKVAIVKTALNSFTLGISVTAVLSVITYFLIR